MALSVKPKGLIGLITSNACGKLSLHSSGTWGPSWLWWANLWSWYPFPLDDL